MAILGNITIADADITEFYPNVDDLKFEGQTDFSDAIDISKRELYREIRRTTGKTSVEMDKIRDLSERNIKDKLINRSLSEIFLVNGMLDMAEAYKSKSDSISIYFHDDDDDDSTVDDGEESRLIYKRFGR